MKTRIQSLVVFFSLPQRKKTKCKVELVSSHSDNERDNMPLEAHSLEGFAVSELYKNDKIPSVLRYLPKVGETVVYEEIFQSLN